MRLLVDDLSALSHIFPLKKAIFSDSVTEEVSINLPPRHAPRILEAMARFEGGAHQRDSLGKASPIPRARNSVLRQIEAFELRNQCKFLS